MIREIQTIPNFIWYKLPIASKPIIYVARSNRREMLQRVEKILKVKKFLILNAIILQFGIIYPRINWGIRRRAHWRSSAEKIKVIQSKVVYCLVERRRFQGIRKQLCRSFILNSTFIWAIQSFGIDGVTT